MAQLEVLVAANSQATAWIWVFGLTPLHLRRARTEFYKVQEFTEMIKKTLQSCSKVSEFFSSL